MDCLHGLLRYVDQLEREFHHLFAEIGEHAEGSAIHRIRLNLKKQRALFQLMEHLDPAFSAGKAHEAYGKLYSKLGKVRNLHVEQAVVGTDEALLDGEAEFTGWLTEQEKHRRSQLGSYAASFSMIKVRRLFSLVRNRVSFLNAEAWKPGLDHYFRNRFDQLRAYIKDTADPAERFHECRRLAKELAFNLKLMGSLCEEAPVASEPLQELDALQDLLGSWHDRFFCLEHIRQEERHRPRAILLQLESEKEALAGQIDQRLARFEPQLQELESSWGSLLARERIKASPHPRKKAGKGPLHSAFGQLNMQESTR